MLNFSRNASTDIEDAQNLIVSQSGLLCRRSMSWSTTLIYLARYGRSIFSPFSSGFKHIATTWNIVLMRGRLNSCIRSTLVMRRRGQRRPSQRILALKGMWCRNLLICIHFYIIQLSLNRSGTSVFSYRNEAKLKLRLNNEDTVFKK